MSTFKKKCQFNIIDTEGLDGTNQIDKNQELMEKIGVQTSIT